MSVRLGQRKAMGFALPVSWCFAVVGLAGASCGEGDLHAPPDASDAESGRTGTLDGGPAPDGATATDASPAVDAGGSRDGAASGDAALPGDAAPWRQCGDAHPDPGEACDTGGDSISCDADCTAPFCGDLHVNAAAGEECDQGVETVHCDSDCTEAVCGDGRVNPRAGEDCDAGGVESEDCSAACRHPGDGGAGDAGGGGSDGWVMVPEPYGPDLAFMRVAGAAQRWAGVWGTSLLWPDTGDANGVSTMFAEFLGGTYGRGYFPSTTSDVAPDLSWSGERWGVVTQCTDDPWAFLPGYDEVCIEVSGPLDDLGELGPALLLTDDDRWGAVGLGLTWTGQDWAVFHVEPEGLVVERVAEDGSAVEDTMVFAFSGEGLRLTRADASGALWMLSLRGQDVFLRRFWLDGTFDSEVQVNEDPAGNPFGAVSAAGIGVVYEDLASETVMIRTFDLQGTPLGDSVPPGLAAPVEGGFAFDDAGNYTFAWAEPNVDPAVAGWIHFRSVDESGAQVSDFDGPSLLEPVQVLALAASGDDLGVAVFVDDLRAPIAFAIVTPP